jgi:HSP20 family protein
LAEVAGVKPEAIHLEIAPGWVKISGARETGVRRHDNDTRYRLAEIPCGYFERTLVLPARIETETATTHYRDGLLEIRLAKCPVNRIHRISIQGD